MKKFYLGLDIGTSSVGIACTDENYELLRARGRDLWAVRLFDEAATAKERRVFRTARRRTDRRNYRIKLLQELFSPYITDNTFFIRLNNSAFLPEDKDARINGEKYLLFADTGYTDKDFYKQFRTIYHLRKALIDGDKKYDLRFYYIAIHHILKYRGNFLRDCRPDEIKDIRPMVETLNACLADLFNGSDDPVCFDADKSEELEKLFLENKSISDRAKSFSERFNATTTRQKEWLNLLAGKKSAPAKLFDESFKDEPSFSFSEMTDEGLESKACDFGDGFSALQAAWGIYNNLTLQQVLSGERYVSDAMIKIYERHKEDLKLLKKFILENAGYKEYVSFFKSVDKGDSGNYAHYIGYAKINGKKVNVEKRSKYDEFIKYTRKKVECCPESDERSWILERLDSGEFLPKILNADNGRFPMQINEIELDAILKNMVRDYPETEGIKDKISKIFEFRVPYYVGPLNLSSGNAWAVKKSGTDGEKIYPWNFDDIIDKYESGEAFIRRMTNKCTYLLGEDVLPKASVLYQTYNVLNQLNKMKVGGVPITSVDEKQKIFRTVFMTKKKVSVSDIRKYYVHKGMAAKEKDVEVSFGNGETNISASMSSFLKLKDILGDKACERNIRMLEDIILWHTLHTDKNIVADRIRAKYGKDLSEEEIRRLKGLTGFDGFGKFSEKFLVGTAGGVDPQTGEIYSILGELYNTNMNLMELINDDKKYSFKKAIDDANNCRDYDREKRINEAYVSPAVRRGIRQTFKMVDEYVSTLKRVPDKIFIECTREHLGDKGKTNSRKRQLLDLYKDIKDINGDTDELKRLTNEINEKSDLDLRSKRLYLYYRQLGRCMYSGERIDLGKLGSDTYDVDHIIPRCYTKDDSLDNMVLVKKEKNAEKADIYPLSDSLRQEGLWKILYAKGLISQEKYSRLTRHEPLNESDFRGFIARQKTITDQTTQVVYDLLREEYPETKIVLSKAKYVADFKQSRDLVKCRETNDLHHARDAYMNIVVGNVYDVKFTDNFFYVNKNNEQREKSFKDLFEYDIEGAWAKSTISTVKSTFYKTSMAVTRFSFVKNSGEKGGFYKQTVYPKDDKGVELPLKTTTALSDTSKYGGYKSLYTAYFCLVTSLDKKGNTIKTIEAVPIIRDYQTKGDIKALEAYFATYLKSPSVVTKIKTQSLLSINGKPVYLAGKTEDRLLYHNAAQLFTDKVTDKYVNAMIKLVEKLGDKDNKDKDAEVYHMHTNRFGEEKLDINREQNIKLYDMFLARLDLNAYDGGFATSALRKNLTAGRDKFIALSVFNQTKVLLQIVKFFKCNAENVDLTLLGAGKECGKLVSSKDITKMQVKLIDMSPCGLTVRTRIL